MLLIKIILIIFFIVVSIILLPYMEMWRGYLLCFSLISLGALLKVGFDEI